MKPVRVDIDEVWYLAKPLFEAALAGTPDTVFDIYNRVKANRAFIIASDKAFAAIEFDKDDFKIWCATSLGAMDCILTHLPDLEEMARNLGCKRIGFTTNRRGFRRRMPKDYELISWTMAKVL